MGFESSRRRWFQLRPQSSEDIARAVDDEIRAHLEMRTEALIRAGEAPERARIEALRRFGDLEEGRRRLIVGLKERTRKKRRSEQLTGMRRDVVYAIRHLRRARGYTAFALATFALGIGLTVSAFTLVDDVLIRPLPYVDPDRLVQLQSVDSAAQPIDWVSRSNWVDWREQNRTLQGMALHRRFRLPVLVNGEAMMVSGEVVVGQFFEVLGTRMVMGRTFTEAEAQTQQPVVVVSEGFWRRTLGGEPAPGRSMTISGVARVVIGIVAARDAYPGDADLWIPQRYYPQSGIVRNSINWLAIGRLAEGVTLEQAESDLDAIAMRIHQQDPVAMYSYGVAVRPLKELVVGDSGRYLGLFMGAVTLVLLIACANLASVNLARGAMRARELAVRVALGAGRRRLVRQLLVEQSLLAFAGGAAGIAVAALVLRVVATRSDVLSDAAGDVLPRLHEIGIDARVVGFTMAVSAIAALLSGVLPALQVTRASLRGQLMGAGRGYVRGGRNLPGALLVAVEAALALVLLTGGGLLIRSYRVVLGRDVGFQTRDVVAAEISLPPARFAENLPDLVQYWERLMESLRAVPGAAAVGIANWVPLGTKGSGYIEIEGRGETRDGAGYRAVSDDYLRTLNVPLLMGRMFDASDRYASPRVVVINRRMAEMFWPGESPLGRRFRATSMESDLGSPWLTVIGVAGDIRHWGLEDDINPEMYVLYRQVPQRVSTMTVVVRTSLPAARVIGAIRNRLRAHDPQTPADLSTFDDRLKQTLGRREFTMSLLTGFSALALLLAAMGVYGLLSFAVSQRAREIAVRAALGAKRSDLVRMVLGNAMHVVLLGMAAGILAALALSRLLTAMLVEISPNDPLTLTLGTAVLLSAGLLAALIPAMRAAGTDPAAVLQSE
jgi:predicted permease